MKNNFVKKTIVLCLVFTLVISIAGCKNTDSSSDTIYIGTSFPMTGNIAADGNQIVEAIQLAADQVNAEGGINGKKIALKSEDDQGTPTVAATIANKFADDKNVLSVIMSYNSSCALAQVPIFNSAGLPSVSPTASNSKLSGISKYFFRTCASDDYNGILCADFCNDLGLKSVAVLYQNDDYGQGLKDMFEQRAKELGITVATEQSYVQAQTVDFSTQLTAVSTSGAQGIFIAGYATEAGLICSQKMSYNCADLAMIGGDSIYSPDIFKYQDVDGTYTVGGFTCNSDKPNVKAFVDEYKKAYDEEPCNWAGLAYDAAMTTFEAMKTCGNNLTRESLRDALENISYDGITGLNKFTNGDVQKDYLRFKAENNQWVILNND